MVFWNREWLEFPDQQVMLCLGPEAEVAGRDVSADVPGDIWPPVVPGDEFQGFKLASVPSYLCIMTEGDNALPKVRVQGDVNATTEIEETILFKPFSRLE